LDQRRIFRPPLELVQAVEQPAGVKGAGREHFQTKTNVSLRGLDAVSSPTCAAQR
jgi:hypothetical protein